MVSQMRRAVEGRVEHALGNAIVVKQQVISVLEVDRAAEVNVRGDDEGP